MSPLPSSYHLPPRSPISDTSLSDLPLSDVPNPDQPPPVPGSSAPSQDSAQVAALASPVSAQSAHKLIFIALGISAALVIVAAVAFLIHRILSRRQKTAKPAAKKLPRPLLLRSEVAREKALAADIENGIAPLETPRDIIREMSKPSIVFGPGSPLTPTFSTFSKDGYYDASPPSSASATLPNSPLPTQSECVVAETDEQDTRLPEDYSWDFRCRGDIDGPFVIDSPDDQDDQDDDLEVKPTVEESLDNTDNHTAVSINTGDHVSANAPRPTFPSVSAPVPGADKDEHVGDNSEHSEWLECDVENHIDAMLAEIQSDTKVRPFLFDFDLPPILTATPSSTRRSRAMREC